MPDTPPDESDRPVAERYAGTIAAVGGIAIALGVIGVLFTDATLRSPDSPFALLLLFGLACYVYLKIRRVI